MGSHLDKSSSLSHDDLPPKPSFFSRLASPLRSRTRNLADFHIRLREPHRQYSAGDHVKGHVILSVVKPIRITHLTVALHGCVRVYKNAGAAAQLSNVNPASLSHDGSRNFRYHGNGHATLFQDEQVLCGEGRLKPTRFEFEFELIFPSEGLPSSIDFERGTISYMVTATLTRPTTIAPTSSCETKVALIEKIDIGLLAPPRERKVTMQTMRRKPRRRKTAASAVTQVVRRSPAVTEIIESASDMDSMRAHDHSGENSTNNGDMSVTSPTGANMPRSPVPIDVQSEISGESAISNNSSSNNGHVWGPEGSAESVAASKVSTDDREITATVELSKGGCLPGDYLPVKIRVEHNRRIKSLHGVVVTLYRQGRVDYSPPMSLFADLSKEDAKRLEREEYYPKSRTGLGGLSLSSAGSCSVFRKDLHQAVAPLIIDPNTLSANIAASVRVPEDVFPSIRNVPGGLISFKYHVEVVVDLGGKLAGPLSGTSQQSGRMTALAMPGPGSSTAAGFGADLARVGNWNRTIVDTDHLRREKGVISVSFEVVVGNLDSKRTRSKSIVRPALTVQPPSSQDVPTREDEHNYTWNNEYPNDNAYRGEYDPDQIQQSPHSFFPPVTSPHTSYYDFQDHGSQAPVYVPPPEVPQQSGLTDKERVRQAEQRLLPSQPPQQTPEPSAGPSQPSAPTNTMPVEGSSTPRSDVLPEPSALEDNAGEGPSAPTLADLAQGSSTRSTTDDKQELERRRLLEEASAPPEVPEDFDGGAGPSAPTLALAAGPSEEPSAPIFNEEDHHDSYHAIAGPSAPSHGGGAPHTEPLPKYER
ncbi:arrestin [Xylariomycetidae sp. FL2044]|nr:arrestin [Xylariomycetidae sp. FL2044]